MLSGACTVHKVQGLSLDRAAISIRLLKQRSFNSGQMYVALSRVTSLDGLFLTGEFKSSAIKSDPRAFQEYEHMTKECPVEALSVAVVSSINLTISLLNTRSFNRDAIDIAHEQRLLNTDILCLTKTQLVPNQNTSDISNTLYQFKFCHNRSNDKYQSISFGYNSHIEIFQYNDSIGMSQIEFKKASFSQHSIKLLIVYRKNNTCLTSFYETLTLLWRMGFFMCAGWMGGGGVNLPPA